MSDSGGIGAVGEQIERLAIDSLTAEIISTSEREPTGYYYLQQPQGEATLILAKPHWHSEKIASPIELEKMLIARKKDFVDPVIFYDELNVSLVYDLATRRDFINCPLVQSTQFKEIARVSSKPMPQKDFIRLLRVIFRGCLADSSILNNFRNIQWSASENGGSDIQHGRESLGRQITASVQGIQTIPEEITLTIPLFENHGFLSSIECAIDISVESRSFAITPFPQQLHHAMEATLDDILLQFSKEGYPPAFRGHP